MILNYATIKGDMLEFGWSEGKTCVDVKMPYIILIGWLENYPGVGELHEQCELYIQHMFNIADLMS